jgi:hypothetical protein
MPSPNSGGGPFALSEPGKLEELINKAKLKVIKRQEVPVPFVYSNQEDAWLAQASSGPFQMAINKIGEPLIKETFFSATKSFVQENENVCIQNTMLFVTAMREN